MTSREECALLQVVGKLGSSPTQCDTDGILIVQTTNETSTTSMQLARDLDHFMDSVQLKDLRVYVDLTNNRSVVGRNLDIGLASMTSLEPGERFRESIHELHRLLNDYCVLNS